MLNLNMSELIVQMNINVLRVILKVELYTSALSDSLLSLSLSPSGRGEKKRSDTESYNSEMSMHFYMLLKNVSLIKCNSIKYIVCLKCLAFT